MSAILKIFKQHLFRPSWKSSIVICSRTVSRIEWKWWKASGHHGDLELLKWFCSAIQGGHHGSHLENLQITSATKWWVWLSLNMMGGIEVLWKFRIADVHLFQCPRWLPAWNSSNHIFSQTLSQVEAKLDVRHPGDMEIQNCCIIQFQYP